MLALCIVLLPSLLFSNAQFYDIEPPLQFAGFAAINVPVQTNEEVPNYFPYSPFQQTPFQNQLVQQQQVQSVISPQNPQPLLPSAPISSSKREKEIIVKTRGEEQQQELPELTKTSSTLEHATYLSLINDKENFQVSGCGWDLIRMQCHDLFGLCKGGCRDFAIALNSPIHDCRCVPYGYFALLKLAGK